MEHTGSVTSALIGALAGFSPPGTEPHTLLDRSLRSSFSLFGGAAPAKAPATAKINIPAVKIIGTAPSHSVHPEPTTSSFPSSFELLPAPPASTQDCVVPDPAASSHSALLVDHLMIPDELHDDPEAADLFLAAATPPLLMDDEIVVDAEVADAIEATTTVTDPLIETELGEFLLDAVDWL